MSESSSAQLSSSVLSMREIEGWNDDRIYKEIDARARIAAKAFLELGKLIAVLKKRKGKDFKHYLYLKTRFGHALAGHAGKAANIWKDFVERGHLSESEFQSLTFSECRQLDRAK